MSENPPPPAEGEPLDDAPVTWGDMATALENEAGRHRIWLDELRRRRAGDTSDRERATLRRAIALHKREAAIFDAIWRMVERVRCDSYIVARLSAAERDAGDDAVDVVRYD
jgi:hypothetical protein